MVAAPEAAACPAPLADSEVTPVLGRTKEVTGEGPSDATVVTELTGKELSLSLTLGVATRLCGMSTHSSGGVQDASSAIFTLDDGAKDMDRESLGNRIMAVLVL